MKRLSRHKAGLAVATILVLATPSAAYAVASTDAQANNPQVLDDPTPVFPTNKQNEPTIAVDPTNPDMLIAGSNDEQLQPPCGPGPVRGEDAARNDCGFFPGVGTDGWYTSDNGGTSWTNHGLLPGYSDDGGSLVSDGDPVIVFGPKPDGSGGFTFDNGARAYYAGLASYASGHAKGNQAPELLAVSTSDDDGASWSDPVIAARSHGYVFNDKEAIWADKNPDSPYFGRVYISWTQFRDVFGCAEPVMFSYSDDGGATWARPNQITAAFNCGLGGRQGSTIRTGPDGTVFLSWEDSDRTGSIHAVALSKDGGRTFTHKIRVAGVDDLTDPIPGSNFRVDSFASLAVDQNTGTAYLAWADEGTGEGRIVVSQSSDGRDWSPPTTVSGPAEGYAFFQGLDVAPNGRIDLGYQALAADDADTYGTGNATIDAWYVSSSDGGTTWTTPAQVSTESSDPAVSAQNDLARQFWGDYNTLVSSNDHAWFIYTDSRNGEGCPAVDAYQHALDDGDGDAVKPAPEDVCPATFGDTDAFVSTITP